MHKLIVKLSAAALVAAGTVAALQTGASASVPHYGLGASSVAPAARGADPVLSFTTKMLSFAPIGYTSGPPAAGDGYVIASKITANGAPDGFATASCTFTDTKGPMLRVCTVDYALNSGLIVTDGFINGPGADHPVTLVVVGGTGAYAGATGYGTLTPTTPGSDVTLHLT
jgi:allene oxide cyclase-like protein